MSLLTLLIIASLVGAVAFFLAGLLLAPRGGGPASTSGAGPELAALQSEVDDARRTCATTEAELVAAKARGGAEAAGRKRDEERRAAAELERDSARDEVARLTAQERTLAARLRVAEDENRAAFEREEKAAEGWAKQLAGAQAEQKRHDEALLRELEDLRAQVAVARRERDEHAKLAEQARTSLADALASRGATVAELHARAETAAATMQARAATVEAELRAQVAAAEAALQGQAATAESALRAQVAAAAAAQRQQALQAEAERAALLDQLAHVKAERAAVGEEQQTLVLRLAVAEEVAEQRRIEAVEAAAAMRAAEERAKDRDRLAQENTELREQRAQAEHEAKEHVQREEVVKDAKVELAAAQAKLADLALLQEENRRLRDEAAELRMHQEASGELERLTAAHKQIRLDAELMARRLQELLHDQAELAPLRAQAAEAASLAEEVEYLRRREKDLEAQLYASGSYSSREMPAVTGGDLLTGGQRRSAHRRAR